MKKTFRVLYETRWQGHINVRAASHAEAKEKVKELHGNALLKGLDRVGFTYPVVRVRHVVIAK